MVGLQITRCGQLTQRRRHAQMVTDLWIEIDDAMNDLVLRNTEHRPELGCELADRIKNDAIVLARLSCSDALGNDFVAHLRVAIEITHIEIERAAQRVERERSAESIENLAARQRIGNRNLLRELSVGVLHRRDQLRPGVRLQLHHSKSDARNANRCCRYKNARPS